MPDYRKLKRPAYEFYLDKRNFYYLKLADGHEFQMEDIDTIGQFILEHCAAVKRPTLIELAYGTTVSEGVQEYLSDATYRYSSADAFLISTFAHRLMATFYLRHYKPTNPTRVFQDVFDALDWIELKIQE